MMNNGAISTLLIKDTKQLVTEWEDLISELHSKQKELIEVTEEYREKEFKIKYIEDIDFKELYGKANDDTRKYHVRVTLKELINRKNMLELDVEQIKHRISLFKKVIEIKFVEEL